MLLNHPNGALEECGLLWLRTPGQSRPPTSSPAPLPDGCPPPPSIPQKPSTTLQTDSQTQFFDSREGTLRTQTPFSGPRNTFESPVFPILRSPPSFRAV